MNYLDGLNDEQMQAVLQTEGPLLILAGAGSGKTRVLTHRIAYMIQDCGIRPSRILAITFTKKAAAEMKERVASLIGDVSLNMWIGTFHACCARILRMEIERLGYEKNFVIYDESDAVAAIRDVMKSLEISEKDITPKGAKEIISRAKEQMLNEAAFERKYVNDFRMGKVSRIYKAYQQVLRKNNALDFDDIIMLTVRLFQECEDVLEKYRERFEYIMVDEYQDTNTTQYLLVSMLARKHLNLCVVGDDDQSIYSFRGADITNILNFEKEFPEATVIRLERNYRSTGNILNSANAVIAHNKKRKGKALWTQNEEGDKVCRYEGDDERGEAGFVVSEISRMVALGRYQYSDIAVLYRMNALSRVVEEALMKASIPYRIIGGHKFYDRKEIKDAIAYLKLLENPNDDYALKRVINVPKRGIGETTFEHIRTLSFEHNKPAFEIIQNAHLYPPLGRASGKLESFARLIHDLMADKETLELDALLEAIYKKTGMLREMEEEHTQEAEARIANLEEFINVAVEFVQQYEPEIDEEFGEEEKPILAAFLESIALVTELDKEDGDENHVLLMTMHSSKGLEFPMVFLIGLEEGIFPGTRSMDTEDELEEERRLCYVAITRAKEKLYITNAAQRMVFGSTQFARPSRFLKELPEETVQDRNAGTRRNRMQQEIRQSWGGDEGFGSGYGYGNSGAGYAGSVGGGRVSASSGGSGSTGVGPSFGRQVGSAKDINSSFLASLAKKKQGVGSAGVGGGIAKPQASAGGSVQLKVGDAVTHKKFGKGVVSALSGSGAEMKVEVNFETAGMKRFMAQYANLSKE